MVTSRSTDDLHTEYAWKRLKMRLRKPIELAVLQQVAAWREREARERNVPRGRVLKDDAVYEVAQQQPKDTTALARLRTIPKGWERSSAAGSLMEAVNRALAIPREELPKLPRQSAPSEGASAAAEVLKVLLRIVAEQEGVAAKVVANSEDIERLATEGERADVAALHGWRREVFGERALKLIRGELAIKFENRRIAIVDSTAGAD